MEIVELRVHGVHGTSPATMLGVSDGEVGQVAGDKLTGIYRAKEGVKLPYRDTEGLPISVEAYSWGSLTSGVQSVLGWVKRALWLLLLPFALANLAYWARMRLAEQTGEDRWGARAVRWSALLLTIFMLLTPCVVAVDIVSWQCYRYDVPGCTNMPGIVDRLADLSAMQRVAVGSFVPMLLVALLWFLSRQTLSRYESIKVGELGSTLAQAANSCVLRDERLWKGGARTLRLQRIHLAAGIAAIILFCGVHLIAVLEKADGFWGHLAEFKALTAMTLVAAVLLVTCVVLLFPAHELDLEYSGSNGALKSLREDPRLMLGLTVGALVLWVAFVVVLLFFDRPVQQEMDFVGHNVWFILLFFLLTMLHLSLFTGGRMRPVTAIVLTLGLPVAGAVAIYLLYQDGELRGWTLFWCVVGAVAFWLGLSAWHYWHKVAEGTPPVDDKAWRGAGSSVLLATAAWIALLFTSSIVVAAADYINADAHGVADLVSTVEPGKHADDALPPTTVDQGEVKSQKYVASGTVTIEEANVEPAGDTVRVLSGRVVAERLYLDGNGVGRIGIRGKDPSEEQATVDLEGATVRLVDSCFGGSHEAYRPPATKSHLTEDEFREQDCTAEKDGFHASALLKTGDPETPMVLSIAPYGEVQLKPTSPPQQPLVVPQVLIWTPIGQLVWLVIVAAVLVWCVVRYGRGAGRQIRAALPDEGGPLPDAVIPVADRASARKARASAGLAHRAERLLDIVGFVTSPLALAIIVCSASGVAPWELLSWTRPFATISMYVVLAFSVGLIALGSQMRRSESTRKAVGVIWDLTTFWPRAAHPLGPPCYAERVLPELERRTRWALGRSPDNLVILSGHSQGSLIVASMASRLSDEELARVRFLSYGSQIRGLYGRVFPRVFGADDMGYTPTTRITCLARAFPDLPGDNDSPGPPLVSPAGSLRARIGNENWISFFRRTDPLGYRVFSDGDSFCDRPVPEVPIEGVGDAGPVVMTHSGYQHSFRYRSQVARWTGEPVVRPPSGTTGVPTLPPV